ncbi:MAG: tRNA (uridine(54)-C5)-methyltransferase TrmA [Pseudomonadota bacterium]
MPLPAVAPDQYASLLQAKCARVSSLLEPHCPPAPEIFPSDPLAYRMRAEFRMWHTDEHLDYVMFDPVDPKTPVPVKAFPIASARIQSLMPPLCDALRKNEVLRKKLFQVEFLSALTGQTLVTLVYHRPLQGDWEDEAQVLASHLDVSIVGRSRRQKIVIGQDFVQEVLPVHGRNFVYRQYEQSFTQPNAGVNIHMLEWACRQASSCSGDLLELYCGNGNFTLPLSQYFDRVVATEVSKSSVRAAQENISANSIENVEIVRLSAEEVTQALRQERPFRRLAALATPLHEYRLNTLFVDPPRAGLDEKTLTMAMGFETILYISCNPETLQANLASLCASHQIASFALFDQFPYTEHMECGVLLCKK